MLTELYSTPGLLEAPLVEPDGSVVFSNVTGGGVFRFRDGTTESVVASRRGIGGSAAHADGGLIMTGRDLAYTGPSGQGTILRVEGATGLNDITTGPDGSLYVGVLRHRPQQGESAGPSEVLKIDATGTVSEAAGGIAWPNGLGFSPDGATLYVSEYARARVMAIRDGETRVFATAPRGECDGLAVDVEGGVWVALGSAGAIARFTPDGALDTLIDIPDGSFASSLAFDDTTLYLTTIGRLLRTTVNIAGLPLPATTIPTHSPLRW
ncbi:SMP-30/gluconolactonase/LRE family protein [Nocardia concava]|uniref:SMP-30/gluconolactonase/LRE family protein n=1 Tax=Nocardia concava TaxID=257281 RepID=UPI0002FEA2F5|nr:SMP-30/gluconolactonase/LRE family protein [Nocardia concava]